MDLISRRRAVHKAAEKSAKTEPKPRSKLLNTRYVMAVPKMVFNAIGPSRRETSSELKDQVPFKVYGSTSIVHVAVDFRTRSKLSGLLLIFSQMQVIFSIVSTTTRLND